MTPEELNKLLNSTRDQKFRAKSEQWIDGLAKHKIAIQEREQNAEYIAKRATALKQSTQSLERNKKISNKATGRKKPQGFGEGVRKRNLQRAPVSAATGAKISAANTGKKRSAEFCANLAEIRTGKKLSAETRAKLSAINTGKARSAESLAKASAKLKGRAKPDGFAQKIGKLKQKCIVSPYGVFASRHELVAAIGRSSWYVDERLRKDSAEYYYISVEEYIMLTGQDPFGAAE